MCERVAEDLSTDGVVQRGWLGVSGTAADADETHPAGLAVDEVASGSPAEDAGLRSGDVLTAVAGYPVRSLADVQAALSLTRPGEEITVERDREGDATEVGVVLAAGPG